MHIGILHLDIYFYKCDSLKQKRSILKALIYRLHRKFHLAAAEVGKNDIHSESLIYCVTISNERSVIDTMYRCVVEFIKHEFPTVKYIDSKIEWI